jgi:hypothetical protein
LRALAANSTALKRLRSVPLGRGKPKLMSESVFSHSVSPSGPAAVACRSPARFSLLRAPLAALRFCARTGNSPLSARHQKQGSCSHHSCCCVVGSRSLPPKQGLRLFNACNVSHATVARGPAVRACAG